jgi:hypothetical protein
MAFSSSGAPSSWTKESSLNNNRALRLTTGTVTPFGSGTVFSTVFPATNKPIAGSINLANATDTFSQATVPVAALGQFDIRPQLSINAHTITLGETHLHNHTYQQRPGSRTTLNTETSPDPRNCVRNTNETANTAQSPLGSTSHTHTIPPLFGGQHSHPVTVTAHGHPLSSSGPHNHGFTTTAQNFNIKYVDIIICIKS